MATMPDDEPKPKNPTQQFWVGAWFDLLGQREKYKKLDFVPNDAEPEKVKAFYDGLRDTVGAVREMREVIDNFRKGLNDVDSKDVFQYKTPEHQEFSRRVRTTHVRRTAMSDGMFLACPLKSEDGNVPLRGVYDIVMTCLMMVPAQLRRGYPIRGGLDMGGGTEIDGEFFGAALVKAYELESKYAQYPRIVVGKDFVGLLQTALQSQPRDVIGQFERGTAAKLMGLIVKDSDGQFMLDYLGPAATEMFGGDGVRPMLPEIRAFVVRERDKFKGKDAKLFGRYVKLLQYLDMPTVGASPASEPVSSAPLQRDRRPNRRERRAEARAASKSRR